MKNNVNIISYFLCRVLFLGAGLSIIITEANTDSYIAIILGIILGIGIIYIMTKAINKINMPLSEYLKGNKPLNILFRIIYFGYLSFLIFILLLIISTFIYSYFLPFTPSLLSCLPLIFLASFMINKSSKNITSVGFVLLIFSITIVLIKTLMLTSEFDFSNLLPIFSVGPKNIFKASFIYAILTSSSFLTLAGEKIEFKKIMKYYLISNLAVLMVLFSVSLVMGKMIDVYSYPEYSILRKIRFFNFIENIENFISISWFFDIFITLSMASLKLKEICNTKNRFIPFAIVVFLMLLIHYFISDNYYNSMFIYKIFPYVFLIFIIAILALIFIKTKLQKKQHQ